jgi:hypothetical protein
VSTCNGFSTFVLCAGLIGVSGGVPPLQESFDSVEPPLLPPGWESSQVRTAGTADFVTVHSSPHSAPGAVQCVNGTVPQWLLSPVVGADEPVLMTVSFWIKRSSTFQAPLVLEVSSATTPGTYALIGDTMRSSVGTAYEYIERTIPQALGGSSGLRLRWRVIPAVSGIAGTLRIDDVVVTAQSTVDLSCGKVEARSPDLRDGQSTELSALVLNRGICASSAYRITLFCAQGTDSTARSFVEVGSRSVEDGIAPGDSIWLDVPVAVHAPGGHFCAVVHQEGDGDPSNDSAFLFLPIPYGAGSCVINEIMYAPAAGEPEWVEVANPGNDSLSLERWSISDAATGTKHALASRPVFVAPGELAVLTKDAAGMEVRYGRIPAPVLQVAGFPSLNNSGDVVVLFDHTGSPVDSVPYATSWGGSGGVSLERRETTGGSLDAANWGTCLEPVGGTPGRPNSRRRLARDLMVQNVRAESRPGEIVVEGTIVNDGTEEVAPLRVCLRMAEGLDSTCASAREVAWQFLERVAARDSQTVRFECGTDHQGVLRGWMSADDPYDQNPGNNCAAVRVILPFSRGTLLINELMVHPLPGQPEYVELYNPGPGTLDVRGWRLHDGSAGAEASARCVFPETAGSLTGNAYLVVTPDTTLCATWGRSMGTDCRNVVVVNGAFALNDDADNVVLHDPAGNMIDSVSYRSGWHNPALASSIGRSLERISPSMPSTEGRSWSSCTAREGGTPGRVNSAYAPVPLSGTGVKCSPGTFSPDGDGIDDVTLVRYSLPLTVSTISISVYDVKGKRIRRLADHDPGAASGVAVWDGRREDGVRAPVGIYIILFQGSSEEGGPVYEARCLVVLALPL